MSDTLPRRRAQPVLADMDLGKEQFVTQAKAAQELGLSVSTLRRWHSGCDALDGEPLVPFPWARIRRGLPTVAYRRADVDRIKDFLARARTGRVTYKGELWLRLDEAAKEIRQALGRNFTAEWHLKYPWRTPPTPLGPEEALQTRQLLLGDQGTAWLWFNGPHLLRLKEAVLREKGRRREAARAARRPATRQAPERFDGIFHEPGGRRFTIQRAVAESGEGRGKPLLSKDRLNAYIRAGKLPAPFDDLFPDGALPVAKRRNPGPGPGRINTLAEADLRKLADAEERLRNEGVRPALLSAQEFCNRDGVPWWHRGKVRFLLEALRERGEIHAERVARPQARAGAHRPVWLYAARQVEEALHGRDLTEVAVAFWGSRSGTTPAPVTPPGTPATRVAEGPAQHAPRPRWDAEQRRLWLGDRLLREFKGHPAPNLVELLGEFERRGWPVSVPVRFRGEQLAQTWKYLNRVLPPHTIRFGGDGTGSGVRWFFV